MAEKGALSPVRFLRRLKIILLLRDAKAKRAFFTAKLDLVAARLSTG
jgi:hypothetical protein